MGTACRHTSHRLSPYACVIECRYHRSPSTRPTTTSSTRCTPLDSSPKPQLADSTSDGHGTPPFAAAFVVVRMRDLVADACRTSHVHADHAAHCDTSQSTGGNAHAGCMHAIDSARTATARAAARFVSVCTFANASANRHRTSPSSPTTAKRRPHVNLDNSTVCRARLALGEHVARAATRLGRLFRARCASACRCRTSRSTPKTPTIGPTHS
jgi:hypothetical protein